MKITKHGFLFSSPEGILFTCPHCKCECLIEDRADLQGRVVISRFDLKKYVEYSFFCPECGYEEYFGVNPNKYKNIISPYSEMFNRPDWDERFGIDVS